MQTVNKNLKQIKTREDEIVLLPYDWEHKILYHALCNH